MSFKFQVGDKVKVIYSYIDSAHIGKEGVVTKLGGTYTPDEGTVVSNEAFISGCPDDYGEHGVWFPDEWLDNIH